MPNVAILVGNIDYQKLDRLECCGDDLAAMKELLNATGKYDILEVIDNVEATELKARIRSVADANKGAGEVFFYFTGHGFQHESEFFACATNFDAKRPHDTGLSNEELHMLLRSMEPALVVKVVDACSSGTVLLKSIASFEPAKQGFKELIQFASCLESQSSLTGDPLSLFTAKFRAAALHKTDGAVYYTDIVNILRDEFIDNVAQTPYFGSQMTGRETFVDDAKQLNGLRARLRSVVASEQQAHGEVADIPAAGVVAPTLSELLQRLDEKFSTREVAQTFILELFNSVIGAAQADVVAGEVFELNVEESSRFGELTPRSFMTRVLAGEKRPDNFVTAAVRREVHRRSPYGMGAMAHILGTVEETETVYDLHLNCDLDKAQLTIKLTPKFKSLKRLILVVSCAPSLENCYIFEVLTEHAWSGWKSFDEDGVELVRRWYKKSWRESADRTAEMISKKLNSIITEHVEAATKVP